MRTRQPASAQRSAPRLWTTAELRAQGITRRSLATLVATGSLLRVRRGQYVVFDTPPAVTDAARLGGRLDCVSLLALLEVFVHHGSGSHIQITPGASRLPAPGPASCRHWRDSEAAQNDLCVPIVEALAQACRCQPIRSAIATLDSALHLGLIDDDGLGEVFARLPVRFRAIRGLVDGRCESGPESLVRLMLRMLGCAVEVQVEIRGVGRVDFVVDGWLIIECDSEAHHAGWDQQRRDRRRDLSAAALGFTTIRPLAEDVLFHADELFRQLRDIIATGGVGRGRVPNSSDVPGGRARRTASRVLAPDRRSSVRGVAIPAA
ncbi:type IV toxin-antitoxin system AbiEi family antitoxin domain-containing protein [Microbacterium sp. NPDC077184]|uniref:type IV toxin-antitoxin system AbiEi family antitoxin domain-containing protein n=1 Tax=Microbacterium sp. NPDC077184 TaxID=3154764 RepID=UPI00342CA6D3